jgi:hypothetical protein
MGIKRLVSALAKLSPIQACNIVKVIGVIYVLYSVHHSLCKYNFVRMGMLTKNKKKWPRAGQFLNAGAFVQHIGGGAVYI